jgi:hypothetical protein
MPSPFACTAYQSPAVASTILEPSLR